MSDRVTLDRKKAVDRAWINEKAKVKDGKGTRDWSQKEQRQIIATGRASGYDGHHMKSVNGHNSKAADPNNIQFLTRKEHIAAHNRNFRNKTNGYYNPQTGETTNFGKSSASVETKNLSNPLSESQKKYALSKEKTIKAEKRKAARDKAKTMKPREVNKVKSPSKISSKSTKESKTLSSQRKPSVASKTNSTKSKTLSAQRSASKSASVSGGSKTSNGKGTSSGHGSSTTGHGSSGHGSAGHGNGGHGR